MKQLLQNDEITFSHAAVQLHDEIASTSPASQQAPILVKSAGIVFGWVLWKQIFDQSGWLKNGFFFEDENGYTAYAAAHWLSQLSSSTAGVSPLHQVLCGLEPDAVYATHFPPFQPSIVDPDNAEAVEVNRKLFAMWQVLGTEQFPEFRELFLEREGVLAQTPAGWQIHLVHAPYDVLTEQTPLPWPITELHLPWLSYQVAIRWLNQ